MFKLHHTKVLGATRWVSVPVYLRALPGLLCLLLCSLSLVHREPLVQCHSTGRKVLGCQQEGGAAEQVLSLKDVADNFFFRDSFLTLHIEDFCMQ